MNWYPAKNRMKDPISKPLLSKIWHAEPKTSTRVKRAMYLTSSTVRKRCTLWPWNIHVTKRFVRCGRIKRCTGGLEYCMPVAPYRRRLNFVSGNSFFIFFTRVRNKDKFSLKKVILLHFSFACVMPLGLENLLGAFWVKGRFAVLLELTFEGQVTRTYVRLQKKLRLI